MSPILLFTITLGVFVSMLRDYGNFCAVWQQKEYRLDRMMDFARSKLGKKFFFGYETIRGVIALVLFLLVPKTPEFLLPLAAFFVVLDAGLLALDILQHKIKRPKPTGKALAIIGASVLIEVALLYQFGFGIILILLLFRFNLLSIIVAVVSIPTKIGKRMRIRKATEKMLLYPNLVKIGITGSYGKSSTKEILSHLLSGSKRVIKTPENINSEIGVAQFILNTDFSNTDVFVCEMGAYRTGEIALIAEMVKPSIGIITTIKQQHLALFGSLENIAKAKYELFRALPADGIAVTNADCSECVKNLPTLIVKNIKLFGKDSVKKPDLLISKTEIIGNGSLAYVSIEGQEKTLRIPLPGAHVAENIAPALLVGIRLGISLDTLIDRVTTLPKNMQGALKTYSVGKAKVIDDTYNSNPTGFKSAIDTLLANDSTQKYIVTRGMLELGEESVVRHQEIGKYIAEKKIDETLIISPDSARDLIQGGAGANMIAEYDHTKILEKIEQYTKTDSTILLENRMPQNVKAWLDKNKI